MSVETLKTALKTDVASGIDAEEDQGLLRALKLIIKDSTFSNGRSEEEIIETLKKIMNSKVKNGFSELDILAAFYACVLSIVYDDDETDDNVSHGLAPPFCSPISNQDDHETNGIV